MEPFWTPKVSFIVKLLTVISNHHQLTWFHATLRVRMDIVYTYFFLYLLFMQWRLVEVWRRLEEACPPLLQVSCQVLLFWLIVTTSFFAIYQTVFSGSTAGKFLAPLAIFCRCADSYFVLLSGFFRLSSCWKSLVMVVQLELKQVIIDVLIMWFFIIWSPTC